MTAGLEHTWVAHYAEGVPAEIDPPDSSLVDLLTRSRDDLRRPPGARVLRRRADLHRARAPGRRWRPRVCDASASARATGWRSCCRTAPSTSSRSTRCSGSEPSSSSTTRSTPRPRWPTSSATTARPSRSPGTGWPRRITALPGVEHVVAVDITASMPWTKRLALRLPRRPGPGTARAAHGSGAGHDPVVRPLGHGPLDPSTPRADRGRPRRDPVHERHDRCPQGRDAQPRQPHGQRRAGTCLGARPDAGSGGRLRRAADVPRLRAHARA